MAKPSKSSMSGLEDADPMREKSGSNWISGAIKHPGALHRSLGVPAGKKIPASKLAKAAHSKNKTLRRRAQFAKELEGFHH